MTQARGWILTFFGCSGVALAVACGSSAGDVAAPDPAPVGDSGAARPSDADAGSPSAAPLTACSGATCILDVAVGPSHTCILMGDHTVRCFGSNGDGALGFGTLTGGVASPATSAVPTPAAGITDAVAIGAGGPFYATGDSCALRAGGALVCWGSGREYALGRGDGDTVEPDIRGMTMLVTGALTTPSYTDHACVVVAGGAVSCWGFNDGLTPTVMKAPRTVSVPGASFTSIVTGNRFTVAVTTDGHAFSWGTDQSGHLGRTTGDTTPSAIPGLAGVTQVAAGLDGACVVLGSGVIECWGYSYQGSLGRGEDTDGGHEIQVVPAPIAAPPGVTFTQVVAHGYAYCALDSDGDVYCWGNNEDGSCGQGTLSGKLVAPAVVALPTRVASLVGIVRLAGASDTGHVCALRKDGTVLCWGSNAYGELGAASLGSLAAQPLPTRVEL